MELKYVVLTDGLREYPIIFPKTMVHQVVAEYLTCMLTVRHHADSKDVRAVGAGFINISSLFCYGQSVSLDVDSRGEVDTVAIRTNAYTTGIPSS